MKTITDYVCVFVPIACVIFVIVVLSTTLRNNTTRTLTARRDDVNAIVNQIR